MTDKHLIVHRLAASLQQFYPELVDSWICPTCLRNFSRCRANEVTEAHILPQAAGGNLTTVLCSQCNSPFGAQQDRWLGEFLRMLQSDQPFPFSPPTRSNFFEFDGIRVGGTCDFQPDTGVRFIMDSERTNRSTVKAVLRSSLIAVLSRRLLQERPETHTVTFPIPILRHKELITVGFLTAAYLLWFRELGYSWALQRHLEPIQEQIRNPTRQVLPRKFSAVCDGTLFDPPWIGIGEVAGELALLAGIANHIIFLPPADRPNFYEALPDDFDGLSLDNSKALQFYEEHRFGGPAGILYGNRAVVVPDVIRMGSVPCFFFYVPPGGGAPRILYPLSADQQERALRSPNRIFIDLDVPGE